MAKRQAYEIAADIEAIWRAHGRRMIHAWPVPPLLWLLERWRFFKPQEAEARGVLEVLFAQTLSHRRTQGLPVHWIYMQNTQVQELMVGAKLNVQIPDRKRPPVSDTVVELPSRQPAFSLQQSGEL